MAFRSDDASNFSWLVGLSLGEEKMNKKEIKQKKR